MRGERPGKGTVQGRRGLVVALGFALAVAGCAANRTAREWATDAVGSAADPAEQAAAVAARVEAGARRTEGPAALVVTGYLQGGRSWHAVVRGLDGAGPAALGEGVALASETRVPPPETASPPPLGAGVPSPGAVSTSPGTRFALAAGPHRLDVGIEMVEPEPGGFAHGLRGHCALAFAAAPGAVYHLRANWGRDAFTGDSLGPLDWSAWVVEDATWNVVSDGACRPVAD